MVCYLRPALSSHVPRLFRSCAGGEEHERLVYKYTWSMGCCATWCNTPVPWFCRSLVAFKPLKLSQFPYRNIRIPEKVMINTPHLTAYQDCTYGEEVWILFLFSQQSFIQSISLRVKFGVWILIPLVIYSNGEHFKGRKKHYTFLDAFP